MLKRIFEKFRPSPAMAVALLGVALGLGSTGWAANGGAFVLGVINSATQRTALVANFSGSTLQVNNTSAAASAVPLQLTAAAGHPPMKVNTVAKVTNLNADYVDGIDSSALARVRRIPFTLAAGFVSAPITVPPNQPVQLVASDTTNSEGVGQASLYRHPATFIQWVGLNSYSPATISSGNSGTPGTIIVYIDTYHTVYVEVAGPDTIRVHNTSVDPQAGIVTLMW